MDTACYGSARTALMSQGGNVYSQLHYQSGYLGQVILREFNKLVARRLWFSPQPYLHDPRPYSSSGLCSELLNGSGLDAGETLGAYQDNLTTTSVTALIFIWVNVLSR